MQFPPPLLTHITSEDVVRAGACRDGVRDWMTERKCMATVMPVAEALASSRGGEKEHILSAAGMRGYGDVDGYGYGYGNGNGNGYGYGDGYGNGNGYGYGYGDGDGDGDGYGDGDGA